MVIMKLNYGQDFRIYKKKKKTHTLKLLVQKLWSSASELAFFH